MAGERATRRRSHAAANDIVLHDASLKMLAGRGLDLFSFSELAKQTGLTRAPIYARYDSPEDVAIELWGSTLEPALAGFLELTGVWHSGDDAELSPQMLEALTRPSTELSAAMEVLAVARRFSSLHDIVQTSIDDRLAKYVAERDVPRSMAVSEISVALGSVLLSPFVGPTVPDGWRLALPALRDMFRDRSCWDVAPVAAETFEIPIDGAPTGDELFDEFLPAINRVIARAGYEHATASRITRESGRAFNLLYERFDSKEALMENVVQQWIDASNRLALVPFIGVTPETYVQRSVMNGRSLVAEVNRPFRNLRNEMVLAARHHPAIGKDAGKRYLAAAKAGRALFEQHYSGVSDATMFELGVIGSLVRSNGFGLSLLASVTPILADVEWTPASTALQRAVWKRFLGKLEPRK